MIIEDKLTCVRYVIDAQRPHILINKDMCRSCDLKPCVYVCPVENYRLDEEGAVTFTWEACVECGACRIVCNKGALSWNYPRGGFGVCYGHG
jgi:ferredoxin like protein